MQNQPISAAQVAQTVQAWVPGAAEVRLAPGHVSDGTGEVRVTSTYVAFFAADGAWIDDVSLSVSDMLLHPLSALPGRDRLHPQVFDVESATWRGASPVVLSPPEALAGPAPSRGALLEQRHQLEDPAEPPLAVRDLPVPDPARDCARSLAEGHMDPVDWGVCDPQPAPAREVADVPVQGGAL